MVPRSVLFIDPPAFCTTVEGLVAPALRERPVIVAAPGADRATVLALSAEAKVAGVSRGMTVRRAQKLCPDLIVCPPNPKLYARASRALHEILQRYAPIIEPKGYGHAFLDLTGTSKLFGPAVDIARRIQHEADTRLNLPLAAGIAGNKLVSEAAAGVGRCLLSVEQGTEPTFLAPHPVTLLPDLSADIRTRLDDYQLDLIGEIAAIDERQLCSVFGSQGRTLHQHSRGIDPRPVLPPEVKAEFRAAHTLATDTNDLSVLHPLLRHLCERLGRRLRERHLVARRFTIQLAYTDYATAKRSIPIAPAALDIELYHAALGAFARTNHRTVAIRAVGLSVDRFLEMGGQLELWGGQMGGWADGQESGTSSHCPSANLPIHPSSLQSAIDRIRTRWGNRGVSTGLRIVR